MKILIEFIKASLSLFASYSFVSFIVLDFDYKEWDEMYRIVFVGLFFIVEILLSIKVLEDEKGEPK